MADGIKRAVKGGMVTLQRLLEEAMVSGDLLDLDRQITRTVQRWMADPSDAFYMNAGSRLMMLWSKARALCPDDMRVAACMVHLMLEEYLGRGLPRLTDSKMVQQARYRYSKGACAPSRPPSHRGLSGGGGAPLQPLDQKRLLILDIRLLTPLARLPVPRFRVRHRAPSSHRSMATRS